MGSLAPSSMGAMAIELTINKGKSAGLLFGVGSALVEMIYIRLFFLGFDFFIRKKGLFVILQWTMLCLFFAGGIYIIIRALKPHKVSERKKRRRDYGGIKALLLGAALKAMGPTQFVFWTVWSTYLIANHLLQPIPLHYSVFCVGLGIGTFGGFVLYVFLGKWLSTRSFFNKGRFELIVGIFLCLSSLFWASKLF